MAFFREARALKHLHHESIVSFKGLLHIPAGVASIGDPRVSHWAIVQELLQVGGGLGGRVGVEGLQVWLAWAQCSLLWAIGWWFWRPHFTPSCGMLYVHASVLAV